MLGAAISGARLALMVLLLGTLALVGVSAVPALFGRQTFIVYSGSMEPALPVGSVAMVEPVPVERLRAGDVVTYRTPAQPEVVVTHRIVAIETGDGGQPSLRTKGDANATEDVVRVDPGAVLGKVILNVPFAGYVVEFTRRSDVRLLLLGVPLVFFSVSWLASRLRPAARPGPTPDVAPELEHTIDQLLARPPTPPQTPIVPATAGKADPLTGIVEAARTALARGDSAAAARAAEGILAVDPRNEAAWIIKAETEPDLETRKRILQSALMVNPGSTRLAAALRSIGSTTR